jgi:ribosomal protein L24E
LYESRRHKEHFQKHYQQYLNDISHQVQHKKQREQQEKDRTEREVRLIVEADKKAVELAKSKSREILRRNREIQDQIWTDNLAKKKADKEKRALENSVERENNDRTTKELESNTRDHSQRRRVDSS